MESRCFRNEVALCSPLAAVIRRPTSFTYECRPRAAPRTQGLDNDGHEFVGGSEVGVFPSLLWLRKCCRRAWFQGRPVDVRGRQGVRTGGIPEQASAPDPGDESGSVRALGVGARQTRRLTDGGDVSALQCSENGIVEQVVAEVAACAALASQSVMAELVHRYPTAALVLQHQWRAESQSNGHPQRAVIQVETKSALGTALTHAPELWAREACRRARAVSSVACSISLHADTEQTASSHRRWTLVSSTPGLTTPPRDLHAASDLVTAGSGSEVMSLWSRRERSPVTPAAEAKKADGASWCALRTPIPPHLGGRQAWAQVDVDRSMLRIDAREDLSISSYVSGSALSQHGAVRRMYRSFGMAKTFRSRKSAVCAGSSVSRPIIDDRSKRFSYSTLSSPLPAWMGVPRRTASARGHSVNLRPAAIHSCRLVGLRPMTSHLPWFSRRPQALALSSSLWMSEIADPTGPPMSSR